MQDVQYSGDASKNLTVLRKYQLEMGDWRVGEIKKKLADHPHDPSIPKGAE
jgi:hypothetical protein